MTNKTYRTYMSYLYKKVSLYIRKFFVFAQPKVKIVFKFLRKNWQSFIIAIVALPVAVIWGLLLYKWITAPRPANLGEATKDSSYYFQGSSNLYTVKIGDKKTNEPKVEFSLGKNKSVTFSPASASSGISVPTEKDNTVTFKNVYPNTDYTYKTIPLGIKEDITVHKPNGISVYPFFIETNGVTPKYYTTNLAGGVFYDEGGNYLFNFEKPFAVDAKGARTDKVGITIKKDDKTAKLVGLLTVDADWLKDPARVYPVTIDPTVVRNTTALFASTGSSFNRVTDTGSGSSPNLTTYYQELPTDINTAGLWHMNEASGNALDSSGNGNTGTPTGTTVVAGEFGNGRNFNGGTDKISITSANSLQLTGAFTISLWEKTASGGKALVSKLTTTPYDGWAFRIETSGSLGFYLKAWAIGSATVSDNNWHHVAFVYYGNGTGQFYVDGLPDGPLKTGLTTPTVTAQDVWIGLETWSVAENPLVGTLDELRISNIARTPEEIKLDAQRRPYSIYTSEVIDLAKLQSWNSLSWTELGVNTGDGETLKDATSLVAQWNLNETSGTAANNDAEGTSCGGTPANCDGTLTNFATTASQDASPSSGWTANNRRWGAGALMFDGTDDFVSIPNNASLNVGGGPFTIEAWIKPNILTSRYGIFSTRTANAAGSWQLEVGTGNGGTGRVTVTGVGTFIFDSISNVINVGEWEHIVYTRTSNSDTGTLYVNGKSVPASATAAYTISDNTDAKRIGEGTSGTQRFPGVIDSTRIYSRALSASEILSNYQAGNIELQTRVGGSTNADDGTWEAWRPTTNETVIDNMDNPLDWATPSATLYSGVPMATSSSTIVKAEGSASLKINTGQPKVDANTVGLWHMEETGGTGAYIKDSTANANNGTPTNTTVVDGFSGKAMSFNGTSSRIEVGTGISPSNITLEAWVYRTSSTTNLGIIRKNSAYALTLYNNTIQFAGNPWAFNDTGVGIELNTWVHLAVAQNGSNAYVYKNGALIGTFAQSGALAANANQTRIGYDDNNWWWGGKIDEVRISNIARSAEEIAEAYRAGRDHYINKTISSTDLFGKTSLPFYVASDRQGTFLNATIGESAYANYQPDGNTVGLWHLDEADNKKSYDFSGSTIRTSDWVEIDPNANKISQSNGIILSAGTVVAWDSALVSQQTFTRQGGMKLHATFTTSAGVAPPNHMMFGWATNSTVIPSHTNITHALYFNGGTFYVYQDGTLVGGPYGSGYVANTTYEVEIALNSAGTQASYSVKGGTYTNWTTLLAADGAKSNTPLRVQIAQYQHTGTFNEVSVYYPVTAKDSSGSGNPGTIVGTISTQGKIGKARSFNGTSDYISIPNSSSLSISNNLSIDFWFKANADVVGYASQPIIKASSTTDANYVFYYFGTTSGINHNIGFYANAGGSWQGISGQYNVTVGTWYHVALAYNSAGGGTLYINGQAIGTVGSGALTTNNRPLVFGGSVFGSYFPGVLDEVRISNTARTADQIRQAYEVGARTHNITFDFKAKLNSGNLITSTSDLGFTIDATAYGASAMGSNLYLGDKIIVKENYDGTEYIAQGTVSAVNLSTGAVTVVVWDTGSTVPSVGFSINATVFKWQREYFDIRGSRCTADTDADCDRYAVTNLTLRVTDGSQGSNVWLDDFRSNGGYLTTPAGSTITSSTGNRYFQYRAIPVSYDTAVSPSLTSVTLDYIPNTAPITPSLNLPIDTAVNQSLTPELKTTTTDADSDYMMYKIQLCTDSAMTLNCQTFDQTSSQTGWSGQNYPPGGPYTAYTSGTQGVYTVQAALDPATTYFWKSYAIDPAGINTWSSTQATPYSFTTTQPPSAPTLLLTQGLTNPTGVVTLTPYFSAIHNDPDADSANYYQIQVNTASDFSGTSMWDSNQTSMTTTANGIRSPNITYAGTTPTWGATYYWRIKFWDTFGVGGAYSSAAQFTMDAAPNAPALDLPTNGATDQGLLTVLKTTATDADSDYLRYKIQICTNSGMTLGCQTFDQTSSQTGWSGQDYPPGGPYTAYASATQAVYTIQTALSPSTTYFWRSYAIDPAGTNTWGSTQTPYSFTTTNAPLAATSCRILETPGDTSLTVVWTDNATNEDNYEVQRSVDGANFSVLHTSLAAGTVSDVDSSISDGHTYQYRVAPYLTAGPTYGGWCVTPTLSLQLGTFSIQGLDLKGLNLH